MSEIREDDLEEEEELDEPVALRKQAPLDDEMDITPMIDITFLLLIFFLVASKIGRSEPVTLPMATQGGSVVEKNCIILILKRGTGEVAAVTRPEGAPFSNDIQQQEAEIAQYVEEGLGTGKTEVLIKSEGSVRYGEVDRIKQAISQSLEEGQLIHIGVKQSG
jgi:biopolymer transport protein ExbD